jgi:hypothetical protein
MLDDRELAEAIDRLERLVAKLGRETTEISRGLGLHYRAALGVSSSFPYREEPWAADAKRGSAVFFSSPP